MTPVRNTRQAQLILAFSVLTTVLFWPVFLPKLVPIWPVLGVFGWFGWFGCMSMILLSYGRLIGFQHAIPCPELASVVVSLLPALMFSVFVPSAKNLSADELLLSFDGNYGLFGFSVARAFRLWPIPALLPILAYDALPLAGTAIYMALPTVALRRKYCVTSVLVLSIFLCYRLCPAAGPGFLLPDFPASVPNLAHPQLRLMKGAVFNAIPSGHVMGALLLVFYSFRYCGRKIQIAANAFGILTSIATLGLGQHYIIDLILSVPFAAYIWALAHRQYKFGGLALAVVLAWLLALRNGWALAIPPGAVWILTGATIAPFLLYSLDHVGETGASGDRHATREAAASCAAPEAIRELGPA